MSYTDENSTSPTSVRPTAGYLSLATFPNEAGLERDGGSMWSASRPAPAPPTRRHRRHVGGFGTTISGALEMSNVDLATEFTNMITAERGYQANSKRDHHGRLDALRPS